MILDKLKAKTMTLENLEKNKTITSKSIILFSVLFLISAFFLYGYHFKSAGWKRFVLFATLASAGGLISLFGEMYMLKKEMKARGA